MTATLSPAQFADSYLTLEVAFADGSVRVRVDRYHLGAPDYAQGNLWSALKEHFRKEQAREKNFRLKLQVDSEKVEFKSSQEMLHRVVNPFYGKGSPQDCQIVLQLAVTLGQTTKGQLQAYCDQHLGLDCNGFVGNYLWRVRAGNGWRSDPPDNAVGPSALIDTIMKKSGRAVTKLDDMRASGMYLLAEVDSSHRIMPGGPGRAPGHIAITEPGRYMANSFVFDSFGGLDLQAAERGAYGHPAFWAVESTGRVGLTQSWYAFQPLQQHGKDIPGVFRVFRGSRGRPLNFRVMEVT